MLDALAKEGPPDTRELVLRVIRAKRLDEAHGVLRKTVAHRIVKALNIAAECGNVGSRGMRHWGTHGVNRSH